MVESIRLIGMPSSVLLSLAHGYLRLNAEREVSVRTRVSLSGCLVLYDRARVWAAEIVGTPLYLFVLDEPSYRK